MSFSVAYQTVVRFCCKRAHRILALNRGGNPRAWLGRRRERHTQNRPKRHTRGTPRALPWAAGAGAVKQSPSDRLPGKLVRMQLKAHVRWQRRTTAVRGAISAFWLGGCLLSMASVGPALAADGPDGIQPEPAVVDPVQDACRRISDRLSSVSFDECTNLGFRETSAESIEGVPLLLREFPPVDGRTPRGRVLMFGGIHGDEYSSVSIVFKWMAILDRFHSGLFHWRVMPALNPDGLLKRPGTRMNARAVDLNRNFPTPNWHEATNDYWVNRTSRNPRRYPGPDPLSEPESRFLADEIDRFAPDVIVSIHAPHSVLDFDGPSEPPRRLGSLSLKLLGTYPGSLGRYAGVQKNIPVVTIELASAGIMPSYREQRAIWMDLIQWLKQELPEEGNAPADPEPMDEP